MKKKIVVATIGIMIISFLLHSVYEMLPNVITSIMLPVNESIWEHGKLILTSFMIWILIEKFLFKDETNIISSNFLASIICILLTYAIFTPVYFYVLNKNDNLIVTITIYTLCVFISLIIRELLLRKEKNILFERFALIGIVLTYIAYGVLTYEPLKTGIFYDYNKNIYGIPNSK